MRTQRTYIERITITGKMAEFEKARERCYQQGYSITRSGPKRVSALKVDQAHFRIDAERDCWECAKCGKILPGMPPHRGSAERCSDCITGATRAMRGGGG